MVNANKHRQLLQDKENRAIKMAKKSLTNKKRLEKDFTKINSFCNSKKEQINCFSKDTSKSTEIMEGIVNGSIKVKGEF